MEKVTGRCRSADAGRDQQELDAWIEVRLKFSRTFFCIFIITFYGIECADAVACFLLDDGVF
jgi:hypothetical protein